MCEVFHVVNFTLTSYISWNKILYVIGRALIFPHRPAKSKPRKHHSQRKSWQPLTENINNLLKRHYPSTGGGKTSKQWEQCGKLFLVVKHGNPKNKINAAPELSARCAYMWTTAHSMQPVVLATVKTVGGWAWWLWSNEWIIAAHGKSDQQEMRGKPSGLGCKALPWFLRMEFLCSLIELYTTQ